MTKEEAIYCMKSYINDDTYEHCVNCPYYAKNNLDSNVYVCESRTAHEMAIKALERESKEITLEDVKEYCKPRLLTIITNELYYELIHFKIKALEQEPILDKIRAEIKKAQTYKMFEGEDTVYVERNDVFKIIGKYKAEKE